jgi:dihydrofolate synthase / folylpolyglutamate synthase
MRVTAYKTDKITSGSHILEQVLDAALPELHEGSVVAISSKVAALCEGRTVPMESTDKDDLIAAQATKFLPRTAGNYKVSFTITHDMLVPTAGIDESNGNGSYVLWPADPQATANKIRQYLAERFKVAHVGVILTDSAIRPLRWGVSAIAIASSGFELVHSAIGKPDLFGRTLQFTTESIQDGLAAAAALVMGEGAQQTPIAVLEDLPFVTFTDRDPTPEELQALVIHPADDIYAPFLTAVDWRQGEGKQR